MERENSGLDRRVENVGEGEIVADLLGHDGGNAVEEVSVKREIGGSCRWVGSGGSLTTLGTTEELFCGDYGLWFYEK